MPDADLNLLTALDALLAEGSVAGAARTLGLSASAMSRTLARLRAVTGDKLLVRAGRGLVPTLHAAALRDRVRDLTQGVRAVLRPAITGLDFSTLERTFTLRTNEGFVEAFAAPLVAAAAVAAAGVRLRFAPKPDKDVRPLREGQVDLDIGVWARRGRKCGSRRCSRTASSAWHGWTTRSWLVRSRPSVTPRVAMWWPRVAGACTARWTRRWRRSASCAR